MKPKLKPLDQQVIVITGASSGIGLATAKMAADAGARLALVARNEDALREVEKSLGAGERVMHIVADVGKREDLERVASDTIRHFGHFDTWINNAGASVWGRFDEVDDVDHQKVMQTNYWGTHYGSSVAIRHLRTRGGALINIGSVESATGLPFHSSYSASKHAVKAMTDVLRVELQKSGAPVSVTLVRPPAIDTLFNDHSKSTLPSAATFPPPVYAPEVVARAILDAAEHPQRDVYIGNAKMFTRMAQLAPGFTDWLSRSALYDTLQSGRRDSKPRGSLHNEDVGSVVDGRVSGNYPGKVLQHSLYTRVAQSPKAAAAGALGVAAMAALLLRKRR